MLSHGCPLQCEAGHSETRRDFPSAHVTGRWCSLDRSEAIRPCSRRRSATRLERARRCVDKRAVLRAPAARGDRGLAAEPRRRSALLQDGEAARPRFEIKEQNARLLRAAFSIDCRQGHGAILGTQAGFVLRFPAGCINVNCSAHGRPINPKGLRPLLGTANWTALATMRVYDRKMLKLVATSLLAASKNTQRERGRTLG
jgi:hypothetical protein